MASPPNEKLYCINRDCRVIGVTGGARCPGCQWSLIVFSSQESQESQVLRWKTSQTPQSPAVAEGLLTQIRAPTPPTDTATKAPQPPNQHQNSPAAEMPSKDRTSSDSTSQQQSSPASFEENLTRRVALLKEHHRQMFPPMPSQQQMARFSALVQQQLKPSYPGHSPRARQQRS